MHLNKLNVIEVVYNIITEFISAQERRRVGRECDEMVAGNRTEHLSATKSSNKSQMNLFCVLK